MNSQEWLTAAGQKYIQSIEANELVFLIQVEVSPDEQAELLRHLARWQTLPWTDWANACVAVAAVQIAREATGDETSLPRLFLGKLGLAYNQQLWEREYGKRIEWIVHRFFPDDYTGYGTYRYVGPVYRHVGIPLLAMQQFGRFVRNLLEKHGPSFTRHEYESAREDISGFASRFLGSEHGYLYARNAVRILNRIDLGQIRQSEIDSIPGYREGFWPDVVEAAGKRSSAEQGSQRAYADPYLALAMDDNRLELRFDWRGVKKGIYRLNGRLVVNASVNVSFQETPRIEVNGLSALMDRWWSPGVSRFALFRASDGGFVTSGHGIPAGSYYLVCDEGLTPPAEWTEEDSGYLGDSEYRIWRVVLPAGESLDEFDLYISGSAPAPEIEFAAHRHHSLGSDVFEGSLPNVLLRHWDEANARRYWIMLDDGSSCHPLDVPIGQKQISVAVTCPSAGTVRVEPRGLVRQESALSTLPFAVVPSGIDVKFSRSYFSTEEIAYARCCLPAGWKVDWELVQTSGGLWEIPAPQTLVEGSISNVVLRLSFSLRVPRLSIRLAGSAERLWWEGTQPPPRGLSIEALPDFTFSVVLVGDKGPEFLTGTERTGKNGIRLISSAYFADALKLAPCMAGEFALRLTDGTLIRSGDFFARADEIKRQIAEGCDSVLAFKLPVVGPVLRSIRDLQSRIIPSLEWEVSAESEPLQEWLATLAYGAHDFDGSGVPDGVQKRASESMRSICEWYVRATAHTETGPTSDQVLAELPSNWSSLPLERWRECVRAAIRRLRSQADVEALVQEWRTAIQHQDGTALETALARRTGGRELCEAARQYLIAMHMHGIRARNLSLVRVIGELERCRLQTDCLVIRGIAATLLLAAYERSGRLVEVTADLEKESVRAGLKLSDVSPWKEEDGKSELVSAGSVEADRGSVP